jgi:phage FluMu protein Com
METIRCGSCNKKLAEASYNAISIKCPRCGTINNHKKAAELPTSATRSPEEANHEKSSKALGQKRL